MGTRFLKLHLKLSLFFVSCLSGCSLDTFVASTFVDISTQPSLLCRGETTTVRWDAGEQFTEDENCTGRFSGTIGASGFYENCILVNMTSSPAGLISGPIDPLTSQGSASSIGITTDSNFTLTAEVEDYLDEHGELTRTGTAGVSVLDTGGDVVPKTFTGACLGSTPTWNKLDMKTQISRCVGITNICNVSDDLISIIDEISGRSVSPLSPGDCTTTFNNTRPLLSASIIGFTPTPDMCGSTSTANPPRPLEITIGVKCDLQQSSCDL